jgi:hypothetical protein
VKSRTVGPEEVRALPWLVVLENGDRGEFKVLKRGIVRRLVRCQQVGWFVEVWKRFSGPKLALEYMLTVSMLTTVPRGAVDQLATLWSPPRLGGRDQTHRNPSRPLSSQYLTAFS